jgi:hypothetical protein
LDPEFYAFQQPLILIGGHPDADLVLPDRRLDGMHLYVQEVAGRWAAFDLAALSGRDVDHDRQPASWFDEGDELQLGPYRITQASRRDESSSARACAPSDSEPPIVSVQFLNCHRDAGEHVSHAIASPVTLLGSSRRCDLCLRHESVVGVHASLIRTPHGLCVADLIRNQTVLVDGQPVYWSRLDDGSVLQVGKFRFLIHLGGARGRRDGWFENGHNSHSAGCARPASGISEEVVRDLLKHFAEMQDRFVETQARFGEHSQQQMELMSRLVQCLAERPLPSTAAFSGPPHKNGQPLLATVPESGGQTRGARIRGKRRKRGERRAAAGDSRPAALPAPTPADRGDSPMDPHDQQPTKNERTIGDSCLSAAASPGSVAEATGEARHSAYPLPDAASAQERLTDRMANSRTDQVGFWKRLRRAFG